MLKYKQNTKGEYMKKLGYTLAEVLITMTVIGIVAALTIPMVNKFKPDVNKTKFLKTFDSLQQVIHTAASSHKLFALTDSNGFVYKEDPLLNMDEVIYEGQTCNSSEKLCSIVAYSMGVTGYVCGEMNLEAPDFVTPDGTQFFFQLETVPYYKTTIIFDINGASAPNCTYSNTCREPDRYRVLVGANGHTIPSDPMGQLYLQTRLSTKKISTNAANMPNAVVDLPAEYQYTIHTKNNSEEDNKRPGNLKDEPYVPGNSDRPGIPIGNRNGNIPGMGGRGGL